MNESLTLPELWNAIVDEATFQQMLDELQSYATILAVQEKQAAQKQTDGEMLTFAAAINRFRAGQSQAVQIHYLFDGKEWCDTIKRLPEGYKVVRMETGIYNGNSG